MNVFLHGVVFKVVNSVPVFIVRRRTWGALSVFDAIA